MRMLLMESYRDASCHTRVWSACVQEGDGVVTALPRIKSCVYVSHIQVTVHTLARGCECPPSKSRLAMLTPFR